MRLLLCCEFYFPSMGGVQEVMRQVAERMVLRGHDVTVATTRLAERNFSSHNGVKIVQFGVTGNRVWGMKGELAEYQEFVKTFDCDAILIKAAQQWTFDALWPVFDELKARKVFIPCGFSGLFEPAYTQYFEDLPDVLRKLDHLIFYAEHYRDVDFARKQGLTQMTILSNGASEVEFGVERDIDFRARHGIPADSTILLTVGTITGVKGHRELLEAFVRLDAPSQHVTFIMNGNLPPQSYVQKSTGDPMEFWLTEARKLPSNKLLLETDFPREELVQAYMAADLFVFASNIEYSPLVLFEAVAAGTPFLSVPVGNAEEIAEWTGGGIICPAPKNKYGYTHVVPEQMAKAIAEAIQDPQKLAELGKTGHDAWQEKYTWAAITTRYEHILLGDSLEPPSSFR